MPTPITDARRAAARANGAKSHGPKTDDGRKRSSQNALTHGLCADQVVLDTESLDRFDVVRQGFLDQFQPSNALEIDLLEQVVAASWRLRRAWAMEAATLEREMTLITPQLEQEDSEFTEDTRLCVAMQSLAAKSDYLGKLSRHETRIARFYQHSLATLQKFQSGAGPRPIVSSDQPLPPPSLQRPTVPLLPPEHVPLPPCPPAPSAPNPVFHNEPKDSLTPVSPELSDPPSSLPTDPCPLPTDPPPAPSPYSAFIRLPPQAVRISSGNIAKENQ